MRPNVLISCAHHGQRGAVSPDPKVHRAFAGLPRRLVESEVSRAIAFDLGAALTRRGIDHAIVEWRLGTKARQIREFAAAGFDLRIECHVNAAEKKDREDFDHDGDVEELVPNQKVGGTMVIHDAADPRGRELAEALSRTLAAALPGRPVIGPQTAPGPWVRHPRLEFLHGDDPKAPLPGVGVMPELLFATNPTEVALLLQPSTHRLLAGALATGIEAWLGAAR